MDTPRIQLPQPGRRRGRYSEHFKRQVIAACLEPGVSTAAVALANNLNANLLRRWIVASSQQNRTGPTRTTTTLTPVAATPVNTATPAFLPIQLQPAPASASAVVPADIRIELQHARGTIQIHWPMTASSQCAQWLREVLA